MTREITEAEVAAVAMSLIAFVEAHGTDEHKAQMRNDREAFIAETRHAANVIVAARVYSEQQG